MKNKIFLGVTIIIGIGIIILAFTTGNGDEKTSQANNIRTEEGKQIIHITAKGGYKPRNIIAEAGIPTIIEVETKGTYDCSSSLFIPSVDYQTQLPSTGITKIDIGEQDAKTAVLGTCSMGMYSFEIEFE